MRNMTRFPINPQSHSVDYFSAFSFAREKFIMNIMKTYIKIKMNYVSLLVLCTSYIRGN